MDVRVLGKSGIAVSRLCFGTLTLSSCQADLDPEAGAELIQYASSKGVNFLDTAELYENYATIRKALRRISQPVVIASKSYAYDRESARQSLEKARRALDFDVIDIFLLHEQESMLTLKGHEPALEYYLEAVEHGLIRATGISTHAVEPVKAITAAVTGDYRLWQEAELDPGLWRYASIIHPLLNISGIGLLDGTAADMQAAVGAAHDAGIGIYGMKMLGGGHLLPRFQEAADWALALNSTDAFAVGMQSRAEIDVNVALFEGRPLAAADLEAASSKQRRLLVSEWCTGCGNCVQRCRSGALTVRDQRVVCDSSRCTLCGYCATACRDFVLKVI
ncbi:MAG: aldo/keto reductase [Saccharofermentanales bacterium]|jgi:aryl-alcohol dehydrogenase-like predicted oxidoreductase/NAD-dependent dihydropyrimidine dehydrogenase PreA subunit